jgi:hypothetical protein
MQNTTLADPGSKKTLPLILLCYTTYIEGQLSIRKYSFLSVY